MEHEKQTKKGVWIRTVNRYREEIGILWEELIEMDKRELKLKIREQDTQKWMEEMMNKFTMKYYREANPYIGYGDCYRNNANSDYLAKTRTNCLQLQEYFRRRDRNIDKP